jgi:hypothetical protein
MLERIVTEKVVGPRRPKVYNRCIAAATARPSRPGTLENK